MEQEEKLRDELRDARTRCGWIKFEFMLMYVTSFTFILIQEEMGAERDEAGCRRTHEG